MPRRQACRSHGAAGDWEGGQQSGRGVCEYVGGLRYEGGWRRGMRDGAGTLIGPVYKYEGSWVGDKQEGHGGCCLHCAAPARARIPVFKRLLPSCRLTQHGMHTPRNQNIDIDFSNITHGTLN